jgi:hypothetical protein
MSMYRKERSYFFKETWEKSIDFIINRYYVILDGKIGCIVITVEDNELKLR